VFKPVQMAKIAIMGLRKNQQTSVSILHDMEILQLEPLSKDVLAIVKNERDNELTRQVTDQLLRVKALMTVLPSIPVTVRKRFDSIDDLLQTASTIDVDEQVASLEKEKEALLTEIKDTENNLKLVEEFSFFIILSLFFIAIVYRYQFVVSFFRCCGRITSSFLKRSVRICAFFFRWLIRRGNFFI